MTLVDFAQIISAVATAGAVWASLWIAGRHEKPRLLIFPHFDKHQPREDGQRSTWLALYIVNPGAGPVRINRVGLRAKGFGEFVGWMADQWIGFGNQSTTRIRPPILLERGQDAKVDMPVYMVMEPWVSAPRGKYRSRLIEALHRRWVWRNVGFELDTSIGRMFVRIPVEEVKWLQEEILRPYDERLVQ